MTDPRHGQTRLDDAARRRAFWLAAPVVAGAIVGLSLLPTTRHPPLSGQAAAPHEASRAHPRSRPHRRIVSPAATPAAVPARSASPSAPAPAVDSDRSAGSSTAAALDDHARAQLLRQARRFFQALLRYEAGGNTPAMWRTLTRTATPELVAGLRSNPPRVPAGEHPVLGRITSLTVTDHRAAGAVTVAAIVRRGARSSPLGATFERHQGAWRATRVL